jgi:hypothetical protein
VGRRPRRDRPPRLDDPALLTAGRPAARPPTLEERLVRARVTGPHPHLGRREVAELVRATARSGGPADQPSVEALWAVIAEVWGWRDDRPRAAISPSSTVAALRVAVDRLLACAREGASVAFATARPAALLPLYQALAGTAAATGARVLTDRRFPVGDVGTRELVWLNGVAVLADRGSLLAEAGFGTGEDWLFASGRPDLAVADHGFAAAAAAASVETLAFADLDALGLAVARWRGHPIHLVPLHDSRPPADYGPLVELVAAATAARPGPELRVVPDPEAPSLDQAVP